MDTNQYASCIDACNACAVSCDTCASACLREEDVKMMADCIAHDIDCAAICRLAAGFMARSSPLSDVVCQACAQVCEACAEVCARHEAKHCQDCATMCRRCAEQCRRMSGGARA